MEQPGEIAGNAVDDDRNGRVDDVRGWDFVGGDNNPWDYTDHGTHVAGTIAARGNNGVGVAGVAWQASIMPVRALNAVGSGSNASIADAFTYAAANGARVVNASLGGPASSQAMSDRSPTSRTRCLSSPPATTGATTTRHQRIHATTRRRTWSASARPTTAKPWRASPTTGATSVDLAATGVDIYSNRPDEGDAFGDDFEAGIGRWTGKSGPRGTARANNSTWLVDSPGPTMPTMPDWAIRTTSRWRGGLAPTAC